MDLHATKLELIQKILDTQEQDLISKVQDILSTPTTRNYDDNELNPMSVAEYQSRIERSFDDLDSSRTISHHDFMKKVKVWKES
ncbi:MAG: hypothetical protein WBG46_09660 [Nonlabens sp.]